MYSSMRSIWPASSPAPFAPSSSSAATLFPRERTSAYSAATKKPFTTTIRAVRTSSSALIGGARRASGAAWGRGPYFAEVRRRSSADGQTVAIRPAGQFPRRPCLTIRSESLPHESLVSRVQGIDLAGELEVVGGQTALGVSGDRHGDRVPGDR